MPYMIFTQSSREEAVETPIELTVVRPMDIRSRPCHPLRLVNAEDVRGRYQAHLMRRFDNLDFLVVAHARLSQISMELAIKQAYFLGTFGFHKTEVLQAFGRNGSVPQTPASTGIFVMTGRTSLA